jgi:hypothetical protein
VTVGWPSLQASLMRSRRTESPRPSAQRSAKLAKKILRYCELINRLDAMPTNAVWEARNAIQNCIIAGLNPPRGRAGLLSLLVRRATCSALGAA